MKITWFIKSLINNNYFTVFTPYNIKGIFGIFYIWQNCGAARDVVALTRQHDDREKVDDSHIIQFYGDY